MARCFVIQPFSPKFDRMYNKVFEPAIRDAGMAPYRVDTMPHVSVPVENIEAGIKESDACLADISTNNPNVWYELGFAVAHGKPLVIVCDDDRDGPLPFDVQHRNILRYCHEAQDYQTLRRDLTRRLITVSGERERLSKLTGFDPQTSVGNLRPVEAAALVSIASNCITADASVHPLQIKHDLEPLGFDSTRISLAMERLRRESYICEKQEHDARGNCYTAFCLADDGKNWMMQYQDEIVEVQQPRAA